MAKKTFFEFLQEVGITLYFQQSARVVGFKKIYRQLIKSVSSFKFFLVGSRAIHLYRENGQMFVCLGCLKKTLHRLFV